MQVGNDFFQVCFFILYLNTDYNNGSGFTRYY